MTIILKLHIRSSVIYHLLSGIVSSSDEDSTLYRLIPAELIISPTEDTDAQIYNEANLTSVVINQAVQLNYTPIKISHQ